MMDDPHICVTIPAYNEEETVGDVIQDCQDALDAAGYDHTVLVVDDGSTDDTVVVAEAAGAQVVSHHTNRGLGRTFATAMRHALETEADIIVNIDADGQYVPGEMPDLIRPVQRRDVDMTLGTRDVFSLDHMPLPKKLGNTIGSLVTTVLCGERIRDAQSGYRAMTREVAARMTLFGTYTYVQESLIQVAHKGFDIEQVPITFRARESGDSRLISSLTEYIKNAAGIVIRTYRDYRPMQTFGLLALLFFLAALIPGYQVVRTFLSTGEFTLFGRGLIVLLLFVAGAVTLVAGLLADMMAGQRRVQEEILYELRTEEKP